MKYYDKNNKFYFVIYKKEAGEEKRINLAEAKAITNDSGLFKRLCEDEIIETNGITVWAEEA